LYGWLKPVRLWYRREQAKSWPTASALIDSASIGEPKRFLGLTLQSDRSRGYPAVLAYSYTLSGATFHGEYRRNCGSEEEARQFLRGLEGQTVPIQYDPDSPASSTLLESSVETLLRNRPPLPDSADRNDSTDFLPTALKPLVALCALLAFIGLILSIWVHVGALFGYRVAPDYFFGMLHVGTFVVFFPAVLVAQKRLGSTRRKDFWKEVTRGSSDGVRYLLYFFFAYGFVNFFLAFFAPHPASIPADGNPTFEWRGFSGHWMLFYYASFAILTSALRAARSDRPR
jgi:hypothetical protein